MIISSFLFPYASASLYEVLFPDCLAFFRLLPSLSFHRRTYILEILNWNAVILKEKIYPPQLEFHKSSTSSTLLRMFQV